MERPGTGNARRLRRGQTEPEYRLWQHLRGRRLLGFKFRRQAPIGPYFADFVCFEARLIVEADGGQHTSRVSEDDARTAWLNREGYRVLRFWNSDILNDIEGVVTMIAEALRATPHPDPLPRGERE